MPEPSDQRALIANQYRDSRNLDARADLYRRFSTNTYGWFDWVFDRLELPKNGRVLELGCGHGLLWRKCIDRMDASWSVTLSDISPGMVAEARHALSRCSAVQVDFDVIDARAIPLKANVFDAVIANHVLYHVPDRRRALKEIHRVLKPGGTLLAATVGTGHLAEIRSLIRRFDPRLLERDQDALLGFTLQSGGAELSDVFDGVRSELYDDSLAVTEIDPLVNYVQSRVDADLLAPRLDRFRAFVSDELQRMNGSIRITPETGLFLARKRNREDDGG